MERQIDVLISDCIKNKKNQYVITNSLITKGLIDSGVVYKIVNNALELFEINLSSELWNERLLKYSEDLLKKKLPNDIDDARSFVDEFFEKIQIYNGNYLWLGARQVATGLLSYILYLLHSQGHDVKKYYRSLDQEKNSYAKFIQFEQVFLEFILKTETIEELKKHILQIADDSRTIHEAESFVRNLPVYNPALAKTLFFDVVQDDSKTKQFFLPRLLYGFIDVEFEFAFDESLKIIDEEPTVALFIFGRLKYKSADQIIEIDKVLENINITENMVADYSYYLCQLISNGNITSEIKIKYFEKLYNLLEISEENNLNAVFHNITYSLKNCDEEKYKLLQLYLPKSKNIQVIKDFFYQIENPKYLFHLLKLIHSSGGWRAPLDLFENAIQNFWSIKQNVTEQCIFDLFIDRRYSLLGVQVIMAGYMKPFPVDLTKATRDQQLNAINGFCKHPIFFERLLPLLLPLRKSRSKEIKNRLVSQLSILIKEAYGKPLYDIIVSEVSNSKIDKEFTKLLKVALDDYLEEKKEREEINEFNPYFNEKDLMNLYYGLKNESQTKASKKAREGSVFNVLSTTKIIVRGNSFKIGDNEITPLGKVSVSAMIDKRAYKDSDAFEISLNNFEHGD